jgi:hypothetical protein
MTNATAMVASGAYDYLTNTTNFNIIKAAIEGWKQANNGIAAILIFSFLLFLLMFIVYTKTENWIVTTMVTIFFNLIAYHYQLYNVPMYAWDESWIIIGFSTIVIVGLSIALSKLWNE